MPKAPLLGAIEALVPASEGRASVRAWNVGAVSERQVERAEEQRGQRSAEQKADAT